MNDCDTVALIMFSSVRNFVKLIYYIFNYNMKLKYRNILKFCTLHTTFHYNFIIEKFVGLHISFKLHLVKNWPCVWIQSFQLYLVNNYLLFRADIYLFKKIFYQRETKRENKICYDLNLSLALILTWHYISETMN